MTRELVFLLEEPSMRELLVGLLPRILPQGVTTVLIAHEGKTDLERSIPRKLKAWRNPDARFVVVRDQDSGDCVAIKRALVALAAAAGRTDVVVRIACRELEAWLLGDLPGMARVFERPALADLATKRKYRNPDALGSPSAELRTLLGAYGKVAGARAMGPEVSLVANGSASFAAFVSAIRTLGEPA